MKRAARAAVVWALLGGLAGCAAPAVVKQAPIRVSGNLTLAQVEDAVRVALKSDQQGPGRRKGAWVVESISGETIVARATAVSRSMRVAVDYSATAVTTRILEARDRDDTRGEMPEWALAWQTQLEQRIEEELQWSARLPR